MKSFIQILRTLIVKSLIAVLSIIRIIIGNTRLDNIIFYCFKTYWINISRQQFAYRQHKLKPRLVWCPVNMINHKYWAQAMKEIGYETITIADEINFIASFDDFDFFTLIEHRNLYTNIINKWTAIIYDFRNICPSIVNYIAFDYLLKNFDIVHCAFIGTFLRETPHWQMEAYFFKKFGIKTFIQPYGGDMYMMSQITDTLVRHTYISHNPNLAKYEMKIVQKVNYWTENADILLPNLAIDGMGRWSSLPYNTLAIDINLWRIKTLYSNNNGKNGVVKIIHTPNHRYIKGTEYLIKAVNELKKENLQIELILLEKKPNAEVRRMMQDEADILAEQFVFNAYAMSGVEGMASGLPVMANLSNPHYTRLFRLHSYLNECPVLSTAIEEIKDNLRILVTNPQLREELGRAGRKYVEKYHSYQAAQYMFGKIYDKIWYEKEVDLMNMYHPLNPDAYNNQYPLIEHPLVENKLPNKNL